MGAALGFLTGVHGRIGRNLQLACHGLLGEGFLQHVLNLRGFPDRVSSQSMRCLSRKQQARETPSRAPASISSCPPLDAVAHFPQIPRRSTRQLKGAFMMPHDKYILSPPRLGSWQPPQKANGSHRSLPEALERSPSVTTAAAAAVPLLAPWC